MTNKEKAYDEALERAKKYYSTTNSAADTELIELIFPELKGSDDEKVRKALIDYFKRYDMCWTETFNGIPTDKILAWLEKQSKQKPILDFKASDWYVSKVDGKIHNIYYSVDKVKPKFKVGDWIIFNGLTLYINEVVQGYYRTISIGGIHNSYDWDIDNVARLWVIQDAKEGDVLVNDFHLTFIFKEIKNNMYTSHCSIIDRGNDVIVNSMAEREVGDVNLVKCHPATREQRDLLFSKMHEAGYEWDAEKKESKLLITNGGDFFETENYEQKPSIEIKTPEESLGIDSETYNEIVNDCIFGENKPKCNVGDWITNDRYIKMVVGIGTKGNTPYYYMFKDGTTKYIDEIDKKYHLWTIQDAKDGDVLACGDKISCPFIFHNLTEKLNPRAYCGVNTLFHFQYNNENCGHWCYSNEVRPTTKEECDLLFAKMKEAGYEWDAEKKELKKIEQKPTIIDIDEMVNNYANNNEPGNQEFGKPVNCMIRAYRQGLNDAIGKVVERIKGVINPNKNRL